MLYFSALVRCCCLVIVVAGKYSLHHFLKISSTTICSFLAFGRSVCLLLPLGLSCLSRQTVMKSHHSANHLSFPLCIRNAFPPVFFLSPPVVIVFTATDSLITGSLTPRSGRSVGLSEVIVAVTGWRFNYNCFLMSSTHIRNLASQLITMPLFSC